MNKPIIRHCKNCKWHDKTWLGGECAYCTVKYTLILCPRLVALLCRFYRKEEAENE